MKRVLLVAAALSLGTAAQAHDLYTHTHAVKHTHSGHVQNVQRTVMLSCYRGPWDDVIWDRPQGEFLDSLRALGYGPSEALSIGETVCRDASLVGNPEGQKAKLKEIIRRNPPRRG